MCKGWMLVAACAMVVAGAASAAGQATEAAPYSSQGLIEKWNAAPVKVTGKGTCACGAHPPAPKDRLVEPYAGEPKDLSPFEKFAKPYDLN